MSNTTKYAEKLTAQLRELLDKNPSREELEAFVVKVTRESFLNGLKYGKPSEKEEAIPTSLK